jgi:transaldolase
MELFVDSVDIEEIKAAVSLGFIEGITTTPTFMHRHGITDVNAAIVTLSGMANQVHVEALGEMKEQILKEADRISNLPGLTRRPVFKIPITNEGLKAGYELRKKGCETNIHLIYTLNQAYMAAESGASYICPLVGRLHDQGFDAFSMIEQAVDMIERNHYSSKIMVSSVRHPEHVREAILRGAHAVTVPWKVLNILSTNALTNLGIDSFSMHTKLTTYSVSQFMGKVNPVVSETALIADAAIEMTRSKLGAVSVVNEKGQVIGILTDGDLRRAIATPNLGQEKVTKFMTANPKCIPGDILLQEAVALIQQYKMDNLVVIDSQNHPIGMLDIQDFLKGGII